jgi:hypothetical protein
MAVFFVPIGNTELRKSAGFGGGDEMIRKIIWLGLLVTMSTVQTGPVGAQVSGWSDPVNLSQSGAGEQPRLVAGTNGEVQVFWWDRFNGLTTAFNNGSAWTAGITAPLQLGTGGMPEFVLDTNGRVHAFWLLNEEGTDLWHASMPLGDANWSVVEKLADSVLKYEALALSDGAVVVAFLRVEQNWESPAGILFQRLEPETFVWNPSVGLDTSVYYRLETLDTAWMYLSSYGENLTVTWRNPHTEDFQITSSSNGGWTWDTRETLESPSRGMDAPRSFYWDGGRMRIWQDDGSEGCTVVQQAPEGGWQTGLMGLRICPQNDTAWQEGGKLFWMWGQGSQTIMLVAWDGLAWTQPLGMNFSFVDPTGSGTRYLQNLRVVQTGGWLYVTGTDGMGEVWIIQSELDALQLVEAPRQAWGVVSRLSASGAAADEPAVVVDASGMFHVVWIEAPAGGIFNTIYYTQVNGETVAQVVAIKGGVDGEFVRQPTLLIDPAGWLHMAWSGGGQGEIRVSRVQLDEAGNPGSWSPDQVISTGLAAYPQLARDSAGNLYLLFVVPVNEGRGVYLSRSMNGGDTWTPPEKVFDAQGAGWAGVGEAALAISLSRDGGQTAGVHAVWVEEALPGTLPSQGIWYERTTANLATMDGLVWSQPFKVAEVGANWPGLAVSGGDLHLVYSISDAGIWQRTIPVNTPASEVSSWSTAAQIPGWDGVGGSEGRPFGLAVGGSVMEAGGVMHLAGMPLAGRLLYSHREEGRWAEPQSFALAAWGQEAATRVDAACLASGGQLGVTWVAQDENGQPGVFWITRMIPVVEVPPEMELPLDPTAAVESELTNKPTATALPSPTPDLNLAPAMGMSSSIPLVLGGGLAAILVVGYMLVKRRRL